MARQGNVMQGMTWHHIIRKDKEWNEISLFQLIWIYTVELRFLATKYDTLGFLNEFELLCEHAW
jgi:hypothetical protein